MRKTRSSKIVPANLTDLQENESLNQIKAKTSVISNQKQTKHSPKSKIPKGKKISESELLKNANQPRKNNRAERASLRGKLTASGAEVEPPTPTKQGTQGKDDAPMKIKKDKRFMKAGKNIKN